MRLNPEYYEVSRFAFRGRLRNYAKTCGWVLCVGAGTSESIFPSWNGLAEKLLALTDVKCSRSVLTRFIQSFGAQAVIQAAANLLSPDEQEQIPQYLEKAIYHDIQSAAGGRWPVIAKALSSSKPFNLTLEEWQQFHDFIAGFKNSSASSIASVIADVVNTDSRPEGIITFNAEPLLYGLINCHYALKNPKSVKDSKAKVLKRLSHDLASRQRGQVPYYYVHGLLPVPDARPGFNQHIGVDKLVFTESQYLQLSRSVYSWQSATFLSSCLHHRCVFVGLSFADPNLRRWLAWEHEGRHLQRQRRQMPVKRTTHFWLKRRPHKRQAKLSAEQRLVERSVEHLGVQVIWLDDWSEAGEILSLMLETVKEQKE